VIARGACGLAQVGPSAAVAGMFATVATYPLDLMRTRIVAQVNTAHPKPCARSLASFGRHRGSLCRAPMPTIGHLQEYTPIPLPSPSAALRHLHSLIGHSPAFLPPWPSCTYPSQSLRKHPPPSCTSVSTGSPGNHFLAGVDRSLSVAGRHVGAARRGSAWSLPRASADVVAHRAAVSHPVLFVPLLAAQGPTTGTQWYSVLTSAQYSLVLISAQYSVST
jgi:hypothetical protein